MLSRASRLRSLTEKSSNIPSEPRKALYVSRENPLVDPPLSIYLWIQNNFSQAWNLPTVGGPKNEEESHREIALNIFHSWIRYYESAPP